MSAITTQHVQEPSYAYVEGLEGKPPSSIRAGSNPEPTEFQAFDFSQKFIPAEGNAAVLELTKFPKLIVDKRTMEFEVEGWGIKMPCSLLHELPRRMSRQFIELFSKADSETLNDEAEMLLWFSIVNQVNYDRFCYDRAAPQYAVGKLDRRSPQVTVEWHDGKSENLPISSARCLALVEPGESFGAFVTLDANYQTRKIERLTLLESVLAPEGNA